MKIDNFIQKTKKQYKDSRSHRNLGMLNDDLQDVTRIMNKNISDILGRGEHLNSMYHLHLLQPMLSIHLRFFVTGMDDMSSKIKADSEKYRKSAKNLNLMALYQKYGPPAIVISLILVVLYIRFWWW